LAWREENRATIAEAAALIWFRYRTPANPTTNSTANAPNHHAKPLTALGKPDDTGKGSPSLMNANLTDPSLISSPRFNATDFSTRAPLTNVPLVELRSVSSKRSEF
jgi:hypothetical protein